jgi:hypothetical protein
MKTDDQHKGFEQVVKECHKILDGCGSVTGSEFYGDLVSRVRILHQRYKERGECMKRLAIHSKAKGQ